MGKINNFSNALYNFKNIQIKENKIFFKINKIKN